MSLHAALTRVRTEEDVKDAYIEALGLKGVNKGLVDIQTPEIWFEAKEAPQKPTSEGRGGQTMQSAGLTAQATTSSKPQN